MRRIYPSIAAPTTFTAGGATNTQRIYRIYEAPGDAFALTSLSVRSLQAAAGGEPLEVTDPFIPLVDGRTAVGAGGFAFRHSDDSLRTAVNAELARLRQEGGLEVLVKPYGLNARELVPAASLTAD